MTRGIIDLSAHPFAGKYRAPAKRHVRISPLKSDAGYRRTWRIVDGAVRDCFANHPEYLTPAGRDAARRSLVKRVTGAIQGHAEQSARGRSVEETAAKAKTPLTLGIFWAGVQRLALALRLLHAAPKFWRRSVVPIERSEPSIGSAGEG